MLIGEYTHSLDAKGRVFMPAKFREELGSKIIVSRGIGKCLFAFSEDVWMEFAAKLRNVPMTDQKAQVFLRMLFASACECEPDKQGRINIPARLRAYAGLQSEATVIGVMSRVEIWAPDGWEEYNSAALDDYESTLEKLSELGI